MNLFLFSILLLCQRDISKLRRHIFMIFVNIAKKVFVLYMYIHIWNFNRIFLFTYSIRMFRLHFLFSNIALNNNMATLMNWIITDFIL